MVSEACPTNPREASGLDPEAVHKRLKARKREGESFSELLERLTDRDASAEQFIGEYPDLGEDVERFRERMDREFRESRPGFSTR